MLENLDRMGTTVVYKAHNIAKEEILALDTRSIVNIFKKQKALKKKGFNTVILMVDGYNNEPDELYQIPEVRLFMQKLVREVPDLLYFLNFETSPNMHVLGCLGDIESVLHGEKLSPVELLSRGIDPTNVCVQVKLQMDDEYYNLIELATKKIGFRFSDTKRAYERLLFLAQFKKEPNE